MGAVLQVKARVERPLAQEAPIAAVAASAERPAPVPIAEGSVIGAPAAVDGPPGAEKTTVTVGAATGPSRAVAVKAIIMPRLRPPRRLVALPGRRGPFSTGLLIPEPWAPPPLVLPRPLGPPTGVGEAAAVLAALAREGARARRGLLPIREGDAEIEPTPTRMATAVLPA